MLLLDTSSGMWDQLQHSTRDEQTQDSQSLGKAAFVQQLLMFFNTYLMLQEGSKAAVFAVDGSGRSLLTHADSTATDHL